MAGGVILRCERCGWEFESSWAAPAFGGHGVTVGGMTLSEDCPRCGAEASAELLPGPVLLTENQEISLARALRPDGATTEDYQRLMVALRAAREVGATPEVAAEAIARSTRFQVFSAWIKANPGATATYVMAIIAVIGVIVQHLDRVSSEQPRPAPVVNVHVHNEVPSEQQIRRWIDDAVREQAERDHREPPAG